MKKSQSSDYINGLEKTLGVDKEGNLTAGKNLEVEGTTKLNGGFKPIHSYVLSDSNGYNYPFDVFVEVQTENNVFSFFGKYSGSLCYGIYRLENRNVSELRVIYLNDPTENPYILHGDNFSGGDTSDEVIADMDMISRSYQDQLYSHTLTLTAGTNSYVLSYDSTRSINIASVQELKSIMNISSASDSVILPVVNPTDLSTAGLQVTTSVCKIGTANVTAVSDKVTPL